MKGGGGARCKVAFSSSSVRPLTRYVAVLSGLNNAGGVFLDLTGGRLFSATVDVVNL